MIHVERLTMPPLLDPTRPANVSEQVRAKNHFTADPRPSQKFTFSRYLVGKERIQEMFGTKCAFCESDMRAGHHAPVEHYRPKGDIELEDGTFLGIGYYWLAADWDNLLQSCSHCNERTTLERDGRKTTMGKGNAFPLLHTDCHAMSLADLHIEQPLLINPCDEDPKAYFSFRPDGRIVPAKSDGSLDFLKAEATIRTCALQRQGLVDDRATHVKRMNLIINALELATRVLEDELADHDADALAAECIAELRQAIEPSSPYSALVRQLIERRAPQLMEEPDFEERSMA